MGAREEGDGRFWSLVRHEYSLLEKKKCQSLKMNIAQHKTSTVPTGTGQCGPRLTPEELRS